MTMKPIPPPDWLRTTPLFTVGHHEPLIFRRRRGRTRVDEAKRFEAEHSVRNLRRLKREGVNLIRTHFFKGFGLQAEREEIELTKEMARNAHELGIRIETYIQFGSIMYETFFLEKPEARGWIQIDQDGRPMRLCYEAQSFRFLPCYNNEGWLRYMEEVVRVAVEEVKADIIAFDNYDINLAPETCHCPVCVEKFRQYLHKKFKLDTGAGRERFRDRCGLTDVTYVEPPVFTRSNPVRALGTVWNPIQQEWIDFVCESKASALYRFAAYGRSLRADIGVNCNAMKGPDDAMYFSRGVDIEAVARSTHVFSSEESHQQGVSEDGVVVTRIRTYKTGRALGMPAWVANRPRSGRHAQLGLSEVLAYSQPLRLYGASIHPGPTSEEAERRRRFLHENTEYFMGTETCATVAVLRSRASLAYSTYDSYRSVILAEQALIEAKVPFDIVMDSNLGDLSRYDCVVLPDVLAMSDEQAVLLKEHCRGGHGLVVTDETGRYDQWMRTRTEPVFARWAKKASVPVRDLPRTASSGPDKTGPGTPSDGAGPDKTGPGTPSVEGGYAQATYGRRGRIAFLDSIEPAARPLRGVNHFDDPYWLPPKNAEALLAAVRWAAGGEMPVQVKGPRAVTVELLRQHQAGRLLLHLLNYDVDNPATVEVELPLPAGTAPESVDLLSPDGKATGPATGVFEEGVLKLSLEKLDIHALFVITLGQAPPAGTEGGKQWRIRSNGRK